ncbi:Talin-1 [Blattella germanica]|nr:Talin-1 [Blattella germanica]
MRTHDMATLSLRISIVEKNVTKTMQFDPTTSVYDACRIIREKISEANQGEPKDYGLFLADEDMKMGVWLEPIRNLEYYILRNGDLLEYRKKLRTLRVRMLDGTLKTLLVDDSQPVANLMVVICTKIGITNHDEYSLVREIAEEEVENKPNFGTLTLKRRKEEKERDAKMDQLRKKLKTDDEVNWIDPGKTLREQGIDESETVLLRRKFFFSDQNIDSRDPVQLNLLYVQARDAILDGTHPVTEDKACEFAGIQCQIQFGDHSDNKHRPGFLDLKEFLPQSYVKMKGIEKKVFAEHKKHVGLSELEAKVLYTKTARSLKTYGVTFFLVKEKMKRKNKLVPRLLGVTKDSVLRLDEKTKEILKTWPLTTVRRWGASPNTFTLDFGDYSDQYYSVQTTEAEQIQQLIAGYIDIILKKQPRFTSVLTEPQRALLSTISAGHDVIVTAEQELQSKAEIPELGSDPASLKWKETTLDTNKQNVSSQIAAMNAATAQVVTLTSGTSDEVDHTAVGAAITTITTNLPEMTRGVRMIAALMDDDTSGDRLLDAARKLCTAFSDLLRAAEPETKEPRQNLLNAASRVGEASHQVLTSLGQEDEASRELQDLLLGLAKAVANTTAALVLKAKNIAATCSDQATQNRVIGAATQCALATSQLVACAKVVAPTLHSPACQEQLMAAVREVARAVEGLVTICNESCTDEHLLRELSQAAAEVTRTLNDLLNHIKLGTREKVRESVQETSVETILVATDRLFASTGDAAEMVRQARVLGQATAQLIQAIKGEAEKQPDSEIQRRLLAAAKTLADATARMVEAARLCASNPHDAQRQNQLRQAVEELRAATTAAATPALRKKLIARLEAAAKQAASTATQCIAAAQGAAHFNANKASQEELMSDCKVVADHIPSLVEGVKGTLSNPENPGAQLNLINASEQFLQPGARVVQSSRAVLPTVADQASALQLSSTAQQLGASLSDLRAALTRAREVCSGLELESAADLIRSLQAELDAFQQAVDQAELRPLPGETAESTALQLGSTSKNVGFAMAQLLSAAAQGNENYTGIAARNTSTALRDLTMAVRGVAATTNNRETQTKIIFSAEEVMHKSLRLMDEARQAVQNPESPNNAQNLTQVAKDVSQALNKCVGCLPGQKDVDDAIHTISDVSQILDRGEFPQTNKSYGQLQQELNSAAAHLNDASAEVVSSVRSPAQLAASSRQFGTAFGDLLGVSMEMAGQTKDREVQGQMVVSLKNVSMVSSKLLVTAKSVAADPSAPNSKNQLAAAARAVTDSINYLIDVCTSAAPGQTECDNAVRKIQSMRPLLDNPSEPHNESTYFECLDTVMEKSKSLGDGMTGIANHAKKSEHEEFGEAVKSVSNSICGLVEAAAQAAYLVGVSEPTSVAGRPGLVDQAQFARAAQSIQTACQHLTNPTTNQQQVLSAATVIAKHTSSLCNACRVASSKTTNPVAKPLDQDYSDRNRESCAAATRPLLDAVDNLCTFAGSPEFTSQPAKIGVAARAAQEPILSSGRAIIDGSCSMVRAAKSLAVSPRDPPTWQLLANHSKSVSDSIKKLVTSIRDKAPGQKECDEAVEKLSARIRDLDQASLAAVSQSLPPRRDNTLQGFTDQMESSASEIAEKLEPVRAAAKFEAENIGHAQMVLLDQTKTVAECGLQLVYATKEGGGNPKAVNIHPDIDESVEATRDALQDMGRTLEHLSTQAGVVTGILDSITRSMARVSESSHRLSESSELSFVDYQTRMVSAAKEIARLSQDMVAKSATDVGKLGQLGADLSRQYAQLASDATGAAAATSNADVSTRIRSGVQELGRACLELVKAGGACQMAPQGDTFAQREVSDGARTVSEKVSQVLAALQAGSRGTQACINAASTVSGIIGDLDTTIMFATAGTLHAENEQESFADHRENILKTAKALVEDTKTLVAGAASSQEQLAVAAQNAVSTIVQLAEAVKYGAASLGSNNPEAQALNTPEQIKSHATPEELVRCTKAITVATAKAVAAGNSCKQEDVISAANMGRKAISDMLTICKGTANSAETQELRTRTLQAGQDVAVQYRELLQTILHLLNRSGATADAKQSLPPISRRIAQCVTELVTAAEMLKGSDWVDPDDPTVIAENELLGAAASIDAAAKKLASLRPRRSVQEADESLNFDEMILEAAKSIAAANSALVCRRPLISSDDGQWSEGLISAARLVAAATHSLVESANSLVQGLSSEEKLISSAKLVASSTAQLLVACKVKADPDALSTQRLQAAGNAVKRATDNLVRAAQQAIQEEDERVLNVKKGVVGSVIQEIDACSEILRIERELEEARGRLTAIRHAKYKQKGGDASASDTEPDGYGSGYESFTTRYETRSYDSVPRKTANGNVQINLSSPEKLRSSITKVERAYNDIKSSLDEAKSPTTVTTQVVLKPVHTINMQESPKKSLQTFSSSVTTNNFSESAENSTLEQRMLKQHTTQRTVEKRTVTMTTHQQLKSFRLNES